MAHIEVKHLFPHGLDALREGYAPLRLHTLPHSRLSAPHAAMRFQMDALAGGAVGGTAVAAIAADCIDGWRRLA